MGSANFLVGEQGFGLEGFEKTLEPYLTSRGYAIPNRFRAGNNHDGSVLISLVGKGDLKKVMEVTITEAEKELEKVNSQKAMQEYNACSYQLSQLEVIGIYEDDKTANRVFPLLAQREAAKHLTDELEQVDDTLDKIVSRLSQK